jgi:hypothetical protein
LISLKYPTFNPIQKMQLKVSRGNKIKLCAL